VIGANVDPLDVKIHLFSRILAQSRINSQFSDLFSKENLNLLFHLNLITFFETKLECEYFADLINQLDNWK